MTTLPKNVLQKIDTSMENVPSDEREELWQWLYDTLANFDQQGFLLFMNYGYEYNDKSLNPSLEIKDQPYRFMIQLYQHLIKDLDLKSKDILEVGCGRGGAGSYFNRYYPINSYVGIDISPKAIEWCNNHHKFPTASWITGSANDIPIANNSKDILINVESSHCYPSMPKFLSEVSRILRPNGYFCIADFRNKDSLDILHQQILEKKLGFAIKEYNDITQNVLNSLTKQSAQRELSLTNLPIEAREAFRNFMATKDSKTFALFETKDMLYVSYILQKTI